MCENALATHVAMRCMLESMGTCWAELPALFGDLRPCLRSVLPHARRLGRSCWAELQRCPEICDLSFAVSFHTQGDRDVLQYICDDVLEHKVEVSLCFDFVDMHNVELFMICVAGIPLQPFARDGFFGEAVCERPAIACGRHIDCLLSGRSQCHDHVTLWGAGGCTSTTRTCISKLMNHRA